jgi:hypothetical protein
MFEAGRLDGTPPGQIARADEAFPQNNEPNLTPGSASCSASGIFFAKA